MYIFITENPVSMLNGLKLAYTGRYFSSCDIQWWKNVSLVPLGSANFPLVLLALKSKSFFKGAFLLIRSLSASGGNLRSEL